MLKKLFLVMLLSSVTATPGILMAANQIQFGGAFQPLIAVALILAGLITPFFVPRLSAHVPTAMPVVDDRNQPIRPSGPRG